GARRGISRSAGGICQSDTRRLHRSHSPRLASTLPPPKNSTPPNRRIAPMTASYILLQNLRRNRLRTTLTAVAFALPMAIFVAAISFIAALVELQRANEKQLRLAVHHKTTITNMLPEATRRKIEALDPDHKRLTAACGMRWFGGRV